jgi:hypothetical protein
MARVEVTDDAVEVGVGDEVPQQTLNVTFK